MTTDLFDIPVHDLGGTATTLAQHRSSVLLIVNVASRCGLTPQYAGLQGLHESHGARGLRVLGFPCNDFAGQEPGSAEEIRAFCDTSYQVGFPLYDKVRINSEPRHPLYAALIAAQPVAQPSGSTQLRDTLAQHKLLPAQPTDVMWNFEKFLVGRDGRVIGRFAPDIAPNAPELVQAIEAALG